MTDPIFYFEVPAIKVSRAKEFYEKVFGWKIKPWDSDEYMSMTTKTGKIGGIDGGLYKRHGKDDNQIRIYAKVASVDKTLAKAKNAGGKILIGKEPIPGMGSYAIIQDTEGNTIGFHEITETKKKS